MIETFDIDMMEAESTTKSKLHHYVFPTVFEHCYRIEAFTNGSELYPIDDENSTPAIYQLLDNILLDRYADFNGGVQRACAPSICNGEHHRVESWKDVSTTFVPRCIDPVRTHDEDEREESHTSKDILVSWLIHLFGGKRFGSRLGCVKNRSYNFRRSDGSLHTGVFAQCEEDRQIIRMLEDEYDDSVEEFIDLVLQAAAEDSENGKFSLYIATNLCTNSTDAERDEFFAIVTPQNQSVIMLGLFYNRFYC